MQMKDKSTQTFDAIATYVDGSMKLIKLNHKPSKIVSSWKQIKDQAISLSDFLEKTNGYFKGEWEDAWALAHCQVQREDHFGFFVIKKEAVGRKKLFKHRIIINPAIVKVDNKSKVRAEEGCMSFPHRKARNVERYTDIEVLYQVPRWYGGLRFVKAKAEGIIAQIFQHEIDHMAGKNIFGIN